MPNKPSQIIVRTMQINELKRCSYHGKWLGKRLLVGPLEIQAEIQRREEIGRAMWTVSRFNAKFSLL